MNYHRVTKTLFDYFYNKIYKSNYSLDLSSSRQSKMIDNFKKLLSSYYPIESVDINFLIHYTCWTFSYWSDMKTDRKISLGWIVGKKMLKRFFERNMDSDYYIDAFLKEHGVVIDDLRATLHEDDLMTEGILLSEENEKLRFFGEARLYNCLMHTTMYNHRSVNCIACEQKVVCKKLLKKEFPNTYKRRGYEG